MYKKKGLGILATDQLVTRSTHHTVNLSQVSTEESRHT